eukprot:scaffold162_cov176-Amphora_coffeaeformis.AAC.37
MSDEESLFWQTMPNRGGSSVIDATYARPRTVTRLLVSITGSCCYRPLKIHANAEFVPQGHSSGQSHRIPVSSSLWPSWTRYSPRRPPKVPARATRIDKLVVAGPESGVAAMRVTSAEAHVGQLPSSADWPLVEFQNEPKDAILTPLFAICCAR